MLRLKTTCAVQPRAMERRGHAWIAGAFVFCPCHLPLTLAGAAVLLSGTAIGVFVAGHPYIAGSLISLLWIGGTWQGFRYLQAAARMRQPGAAEGNRAGAATPPIV